ncbi:hypothetical protein MNBD_GAMMA12-637 [hydrothermal vent metagenome]|uniref:HTH cro/C1-type domain-containing protein n=1 Tax=hydrothermal vent metagenome TaxID=652676 RepID=A0A3B0YKM9_9ZZZZ
MIAQRIKQARESKGISKAELARRVAVSRASVSMWEDGKNVSSANILKIAGVLDVAPEWIQYGVGEENVCVNTLADCLAYVRKVTSRKDLDLSDDQYARVAAHLYQEHGKGAPLNEVQVEHLFKEQTRLQQVV